MEQKELFHLSIKSPLALYSFFLDKDVKGFDIVSLRNIGGSFIRVGIYCLPSNLFWLGYYYRSFEDFK
jgi:hypothetical protein